MKKNIIVIGFMGVGKGTVARAYAKRYGVFNLDTDDLIESALNKEVKEIFARYGEPYFRAQEQRCADWIARSVKKTLISCGGGFYKVENLKDLGTVVLLDASFEWIHNRLKTAKNSAEKLAKRPLFSDIEKAKALYAEREAAYREVADIIVSVEGKSMKEICKEIKKRSKSL